MVSAWSPHLVIRTTLHEGSGVVEGVSSRAAAMIACLSGSSMSSPRVGTYPIVAQHMVRQWERLEGQGVGVEG